MSQIGCAKIELDEDNTMAAVLTSNIYSVKNTITSRFAMNYGQSEIYNISW